MGKGGGTGAGGGGVMIAWMTSNFRHTYNKTNLNKLAIVFNYFLNIPRSVAFRN
jgi:hypothetical protein